MGMNRRDFLKVMTAAASAVAAGACDVKDKAPKIIPYVVPPEEEIVPGFPLYYKTSLPDLPDQPGVTVTAYDKVIGTAHEICPTKLEGTPGHPINDGALSMQGQAELYRFYSPQRLKAPSRPQPDGTFAELSGQGGDPAPEPAARQWNEAFAIIAAQLQQAAAAGKTNYYLSGRTTGALSRLIDEFCAASGVRRLREYEPFSYAAIRRANGILFGDAALPLYRIEECDYLLTVGADIMETFVSPVNYARQFARARSRNGLHWHHCGVHVTSTAMAADERYSIRPASDPWLLAYILRQVARQGWAKNAVPPDVLAALPEVSAAAVSEKTGLPIGALNRLVNGFEKAGHPLLIAGGTATAHESGLETAVLAGLIQWATGQIGDTVDFTRAENYETVGDLDDMKALSEELASGDGAGVIFVSRTDPLYHLPAEFRFSEGLSRAQLIVGLGLLPNETLRACHLVLPLSHALESWGDVAPRRGVLAPVQPASKPLFNTRSEGDVLIGLLQALGRPVPAPSMQEYVFSGWTKRGGEEFTDRFLSEGYFVEDVARAEMNCRFDAAAAALREARFAEPRSGLTLLIAPSPRMLDGRMAELDGAPRQNLLREIPDTVTSITYGEWVSVPPALADELALSDKLLEVDVVEVTVGGTALRLPVKIQPRQSAEVLVVQRGFTSSALRALYRRAGAAPGGEHVWFLDVTRVVRTGEKNDTLCIMSGSQSQEGRGFIPFPLDEKKWEEYERTAGLHTTGHNTHGGRRLTAVLPASGKGGGGDEPHGGAQGDRSGGTHVAGGAPGAADHDPEQSLEGFAKKHIGVHKGLPGGLYTGHTYPEYRWAMAIDLDLCTGCGACVAACYVENTIPVVGPDDHIKGREMSWIRVETYFEKSGDTFLPMLCQHCDYAPCEPVCPVYATYHNPEGLNAMVYSRCVGTRYCFNNCPYKVRRFNWWDHQWPSPLDRMSNPMVWVRSKGVMEKCTFCVQRIRAAKDYAKDDGRRQVRDGEVKTACQQTCPAQAIVFGNLKDEQAAVTRAATSQRTYRVLDMLGVEPAVYYLHGKPRVEHGGHGHQPETKLPVGRDGRMPSASGVRPGEEFQPPRLRREVTVQKEGGTSPSLTGNK
ncbi:MAG: hypothetical protein Kow0059_20270 [Candidatus Sumerlaeia bacterium]